MSTLSLLREPQPEPLDVFGALAISLSLGGDGPRGIVKDNFDVAGLPTSCGSARFARGDVANANAEVVQALVSGGARLIGRARMHELAYGVTGINHWSGTPINPAAPDRVPGGSSSGCAVAVASGLADFAVGTDTGGSIRVPAACCGVFGLKPSFGFVSRVGVHPSRSSLDCVGVMARDLATIDQVMKLIVPGTSEEIGLTSTAIKVLRTQAEPEILESFWELINTAAWDGDEVVLPTMRGAFEAGLSLIAAEMWQEYSWLAPDFEGIGDDVAQRLRRAADVNESEVRDARAFGQEFTHEVDDLLGLDNFLVLPTLPCAPTLLRDADSSVTTLKLTELVRPFNLSGHPALTIPFTLSVNRSVNMQIVGRRGKDAELCAFAERFAARINHKIGVKS
jgi:amidase